MTTTTRSNTFSVKDDAGKDIISYTYTYSGDSLAQRVKAEAIVVGDTPFFRNRNEYTEPKINNFVQEVYRVAEQNDNKEIRAHVFAMALQKIEGAIIPALITEQDTFGNPTPAKKAADVAKLTLKEELIKADTESIVSIGETIADGIKWLPGGSGMVKVGNKMLRASGLKSILKLVQPEPVNTLHARWLREHTNVLSSDLVEFLSQEARIGGGPFGSMTFRDVATSRDEKLTKSQFYNNDEMKKMFRFVGEGEERNDEQDLNEEQAWQFYDSMHGIAAPNPYKAFTTNFDKFLRVAQTPLAEEFEDTKKRFEAAFPGQLDGGKNEEVLKEIYNLNTVPNIDDYKSNQNYQNLFGQENYEDFKKYAGAGQPLVANQKLRAALKNVGGETKDKLEYILDVLSGDKSSVADGTLKKALYNIGGKSQTLLDGVLSVIAGDTSLKDAEKGAFGLVLDRDIVRTLLTAHGEDWSALYGVSEVGDATGNIQTQRIISPKKVEQMIKRQAAMRMAMPTFMANRDAAAVSMNAIMRYLGYTDEDIDARVTSVGLVADVISFSSIALPYLLKGAEALLWFTDLAFGIEEPRDVPLPIVRPGVALAAEQRTMWSVNNWSSAVSGVQETFLTHTKLIAESANGTLGRLAAVGLSTRELLAEEKRRGEYDPFLQISAGRATAAVNNDVVLNWFHRLLRFPRRTVVRFITRKGWAADSGRTFTCGGQNVLAANNTRKRNQLTTIITNIVKQETILAKGTPKELFVTNIQWLFLWVHYCLVETVEKVQAANGVQIKYDETNLNFVNASTILS